MTSSTGLLTVNLSALTANWLMLQNKVNSTNSESFCSAVVKANAYGLDVLKVAPALHSVGCKHFFVATLKEGIELREFIGNEVEIYVLGGLSHGLGSEWQSYRLIPVIFSLEYVDQWIIYCQQYSVSLPCVFELDSGMHRLGMQPGELEELFQRAEVQQLNVSMLMSHLACSDMPEHPLNQHQLNQFEKVARVYKKQFPQGSLSFPNSSGIFLGKKYHSDIARPGAALYGVNPTPHLHNPMKSVVKLELPIMQIRIIEPGETVGYGATFTAQRLTRMAVVFGGYDDGLTRLFSNRGSGYCNGKVVPQIGRVSMDSMVFDITEIDGTPKTIEILNEHQGVDVLAKITDTIGYEVLTNLGRRYHRECIQDDS
jgi:alanine racemase